METDWGCRYVWRRMAAVESQRGYEDEILCNGGHGSPVFSIDWR